MMRLVCALRDCKAEMFLNPFFVPTLGVAYRNLMDEIARGGADNVLAAHAADFDLYQLGSFDDESGDFLTTGMPTRVCSVDTLRAPAGSGL